MEPLSAMAEKIVDAIWKDLTDRRGIRQAFDEIDDDIQHDMHKTHIKIVLPILVGYLEEGIDDE